MSEQSPTPEHETTLRLLWPQWQGARGDIFATYTAEGPQQGLERGYALGTSVLAAVLPEHDGPTVRVPVEMGDRGLDEVDGIPAKEVIREQLDAALRLLAEHRPARVVTLGGECSVSVAPFSALAERYGEDLAVVWIDSHPDVATSSSAYNGYHAMAVSVLTGKGDRDLVAQLPATVAPQRVALAGVHNPAEDDLPNVAAWGITAFGPEDLREDSAGLLAWLAGTGCTKVAIHLDVDSIDAGEAFLGMVAETGGLSTAQVRRVMADVAGVADVVGLTIAEYVPRQVLQLRELVTGMPLI